MKLLLDRGLPRSASALLRKVGIDTIHVAEIDLSASEDIIILEKARAENRVVITLDADFHALLALENASSPSVIRIRIERLRAHALVTLLQTVIEQCNEDLELGAMVTVEPSRIRSRRLPLLT